MTVVVAVLSYVAIQTIGPFAILLPFVFGHFLLFCNVFRIGTDFEVLWACWLIVIVTVTSFLDCLDWWLILALQTPLTVLLVILAMRSPRYHGIGCRKINPDLNAYLNDPKRNEGFVLRTVRRLFRFREADPTATRREEKHP
ncbi:MAG: hypothetical protein C0467_24330 [Planctomycetaceae bacterium]|nr:hypothetical protein [Planctomycetaceae bacterium]